MVLNDVCELFVKCVRFLFVSDGCVCLFCCISPSMFAFMIGICASLWLVCLVLYLCFMRSLMFCGGSLCMWCISVVRTMFVSIVFVVRMLSGQLTSWNDVFISCVIAGRSAV